jgi:predicted N-acetyltransferase YhbS
VIRDAAAGDYAAMAAITLAANEQYAVEFPAEWWTGYSNNIVATLRTDGEVERIVAERDGVLVGSVLLYPAATQDSGWPEIRLLAVIPQVRGQGIGTALIDECLRRASLWGATTIGLHTMEVMSAARHMYEKMGFKRAPEHDFHPVAGLTILGYRLDLTTESNA